MELRICVCELCPSKADFFLLRCNCYTDEEVDVQVGVVTKVIVQL